MKSVRTTLIAAVCMLISATSSSQKTFNSPVEFNDYLVSITDSLYKGGQAWGRKLNTVMKSKSFDYLTVYRMNLESLISRKKLELKSLKDYKGSKELVDIMIDFLTFEAKLSREGFAPVEDLTDKSTKEEIDTALKKIVQLSESETDFLNRVAEAQRRYAEKNGFTIEED